MADLNNPTELELFAARLEEGQVQRDLLDAWEVILNSPTYQDLAAEYAYSSLVAYQTAAINAYTELM